MVSNNITSAFSVSSDSLFFPLSCGCLFLLSTLASPYALSWIVSFLYPPTGSLCLFSPISPWLLTLDLSCFPSDSKLSDPSPRCGGVQCVPAAPEPREKPEYGRVATGSCPGLPCVHRGWRQQLHQCGTDGQLSETCQLCGDATPIAHHYRRLLEAGVWLQLHIHRNA